MSNTINSINLTIELTKYCNFHCTYCSQGLNHEDKEIMTFNYFKMNLLLFKRECLKKGIKKFFIIIQGGELSIFGKEILPYFEFINKLFSNAQDSSTRVVFPTNFSGNLTLYKSIIDIFEKSSILFVVNISLHKELLELKYENKLRNIHTYLFLLDSKSVLIEISILKIQDFMTVYNNIIEFIKNNNMLYYYDELDENDTSPMNLLYCTLDLNGFKDNLNEGKIQCNPFRIKDLLLSNKNNSHYLEIENKRKISYDNELELLKNTRG